MRCCRCANSLCPARCASVIAASSTHRSWARSIPEQSEQNSAVSRRTMKPLYSLFALLPMLAACKDKGLSSAQATQLPAQQTEQIGAGRRTAITAAVQRVAPSVVTVQTEVVERVPADVSEQFFGGRAGTRSAAGLGSGFMVSENG